MWGQLIIFLTTVICLYLLIRELSGKFKDVKIVTSLALFIWLLSQVVYTGEFNFYEDIYHDFNNIITISLILSAELMIVRVMRPALFRYPYFLVYTPFLIPVSFILIINTYLIKDLVFMITQGIALFVYLLFMLDKSEIRLINIQSIIGVLLLIIAYITYWLLQNFIPIPAVLWQSLLAIGSLLLVHSLVNNLELKT